MMTIITITTIETDRYNKEISSTSSYYYYNEIMDG